MGISTRYHAIEDERGISNQNNRGHQKRDAQHAVSNRGDHKTHAVMVYSRSYYTHSDLEHFLNRVQGYVRMPPVSRSQPYLRWAPGLPTDANYFWDEPTPAQKWSPFTNDTDRALLPPDGVNLSDAWTAKIVLTSTINGATRHQKWPAIFATKARGTCYFAISRIPNRKERALREKQRITNGRRSEWTLKRCRAGLWGPVRSSLSNVICSF